MRCLIGLAVAGLLLGACGDDPAPARPVAPPSPVTESPPDPIEPVTPDPAPARHPPRPEPPEGPWHGRRTYVVLSDADDTPLEGALVRVAHWDHVLTGAPDGDGSVLREGRTDAAGRVDLPVPEELAKVAVRHPGFVLRTLALDDVDEDGTIRLSPIAGSLAGRVLTDDERPVAGARVRAWEAETGGDVLDLVQTTDEDGRFRLANAAPESRLRIAVVCDGFAPASVVLPPGRRPDSVELRLGDGAQVTGTVADGDGPVEGASVFVFAPDDFPPWVPFDRYANGRSPEERRFLVARARSGPDGSFTLRGLDAGSTFRVAARTADGRVGESAERLVTEQGTVAGVAITVAKTGRIEITVEMDTEDVEPGDLDVTRGGRRTEVPRSYEARKQTDSVLVLDGVPAGVHDVFVRHPRVLDLRRRITVDPGGTARLTVRVGSGVALTGRLRRSDGEPVAGAYVIWEWPGDDRRPSIEASDPTGPDGTFTLRGLPETAGRLTAFAGALRLLERTDVQAGQDLGDVTVEDRARVAGRLVDDIPAATTFRFGIRWPDGRSHVQDRGWPGSEADRVLEFDGVPLDERVHLFVHVPGRPAWVRRNVRAKNGENLELGDIVFPKAARVEGVVRRENGDPIPKATIWLSEPWFPGHVTADDTGRYTIDLLPPGRSAFRVEVGGQPRAYKPVQLVSGDQAIDLVVKDQGTVVAVVKDAAGRPVAGLDFAFHPLDRAGNPDRRREIVVTTNGKGVVSVPALVGRYGMAPAEDTERTLAQACPPLVVENDKTTRVELVVD